MFNIIQQIKYDLNSGTLIVYTSLTNIYYSNRPFMEFIKYFTLLSHWVDKHEQSETHI